MASADGGVRYTLAQAFTPKIPRAMTSKPTTSNAAITKPLAPPGKFLIFALGPGLENFQMKIARTNCAARKEIPASAMVSDICSSIKAPCVEMSSGATQVCRKMGIAERIAITMMVTAKNFAMCLASRRLSDPAFCRVPQNVWGDQHWPAQVSKNNSSGDHR